MRITNEISTVEEDEVGRLLLARSPCNSYDDITSNDEDDTVPPTASYESRREFDVPDDRVDDDGYNLSPDHFNNERIITGPTVTTYESLDTDEEGDRAPSDSLNQHIARRFQEGSGFRGIL